jgi:predicted GIY-YIG superfamily endonuclease
MYVVYALCDPDELYKVCYIGISQDIYNRFFQHLRDTESNSLKAQWLKGLRERNRVPYCKVLEEVKTEEDARDREAYWVQFYVQLHMPLTNAVIPQILTFHPRYSRLPPSKDAMEKARRMLSQGIGYKRIALNTGLTEYNVRKIATENAIIIEDVNQREA